MAEYQGHHCKNCWNVALWIGNDELLYRFAMDCLKRAKDRPAIAAKYFSREVSGRTPDGAKYTLQAIKNALAGLVD